MLLELVFEVLIYTIPQSTGHALAYVLTFGRVKLEDHLAEIVGVIFWILVFLAVVFFVWKTH